MLIVLSPAKTLDLSPAPRAPTPPLWPDEAARLARRMRNLTLGELRGLMDLSDDLARLNRDRFRAWQDEPSETFPAIYAFAGDTYQGLQARELSQTALDAAETRLRLLSGLYGLLRPFDGIQPYRLEMGSRLRTRRGDTLYDFWGDRIATELNATAKAAGTDVLLNCASQEYFAAADRPALTLRVVTPEFLELKDNRPRIVSFFAKRARGRMAAFVLDQGITDPADLRAFDRDGYVWQPDLSRPDRPVFLRPYPDPKSG